MMTEDKLFDVKQARQMVEVVRGRYQALDLSDRFVYHEHDGPHEFDKSDAGLDFLSHHLGF
ncbi:hypothetical protein [Coraliomargarita parva]|uniref:hypothetical protein n=1 Tax=Coraliomargarita parva TaxID=3014050 RepID=UPI0022B48946|nr:hypothetical protein [Coraliomargarita parva]